jgi:hypothetical protein
MLRLRPRSLPVDSSPRGSRDNYDDWEIVREADGEVVGEVTRRAGQWLSNAITKTTKEEAEEIERYGFLFGKGALVQSVAPYGVCTLCSAALGEQPDNHFTLAECPMCSRPLSPIG